MDNKKRIEWIDHYLLGQLKEEELSQFELYMQTDASFKREVDVQRAILLNLRKVGRSATRQQIREIQERIDLPWPEERPLQAKSETQTIPIGFPRFPKTRNFPYYAIAATLTLLLITSVIGYFFYKYAGSPVTPTALQNKQKEIRSNVPKVVVIPLERSGGSREHGFGGADKKDTTIAVLLYQNETSIKSYQYDDTLRLYGSFSPDQLTLQFDQKTGQYTLRENSVSYPLQRYQPKKFLKATH